MSGYLMPLFMEFSMSKKFKTLISKFIVADTSFEIKVNTIHSIKRNKIKYRGTLEPGKIQPDIISSFSSIEDKDRSCQNFYENHFEIDNLIVNSNLRIGDIKKKALEEYEVKNKEKYNRYVKKEGLADSYKILEQGLINNLINKYNTNLDKFTLDDSILRAYLDDMANSYDLNNYAVYDSFLTSEFIFLADQGHHASKFFAGALILSDPAINDINLIIKGVSYLIDAHEYKIFNALDYLARWLFLNGNYIYAFEVALISNISKSESLSTILEIYYYWNDDRSKIKFLEALRPEFVDLFKRVHPDCTDLVSQLTMEGDSHEL